MGYRLYEDEQGRKYSAYFGNSDKPNPRTWATLNKHGERDMPIFTYEYLEYEGISRSNYVDICILL